MGPECLDRIIHPKMEYYRHVYRFSRRLDNNTKLDGKIVCVYCEQGYGDIIQFARYIPLLKNRCSEVILHCPKALHRLFAQFGCQMIDKSEETLPFHDYHVLSLSLPFLLGEWDLTSPYLKVNESEVFPVACSSPIKIGIAWEGNPNNKVAPFRDCPLSYFKPLVAENTTLFMLQKGSASLTDELLNQIPLWSMKFEDFYDVAKLINDMDFVVSVDTAVLHLAGAMGKLVFGILSKTADPRWEISAWYDSAVLIKQNEENDWAKIFTTLVSLLESYEYRIGEDHV